MAPPSVPGRRWWGEGKAPSVEGGRTAQNEPWHIHRRSVVTVYQCGVKQTGSPVCAKKKPREEGGARFGVSSERWLSHRKASIGLSGRQRPACVGASPIPTATKP